MLARRALRSGRRAHDFINVSLTRDTSDRAITLMRAGLVGLQVGPERCCGVVVSHTHVLTSCHQLRGASEVAVDDGTSHLWSRGQVIDRHPGADLAVVAVATPKPAWTPQLYGGGSGPAYGRPVELAGLSAGSWSAEATCRQPVPVDRGGFSVDTQPLVGRHGHSNADSTAEPLTSPERWVPWIGDSGSAAWLAGVVVGVCSRPVRHSAGCRDGQMLYTFIDATLAAWIGRALGKPYPRRLRIGDAAFGGSPLA